MIRGTCPQCGRPYTVDDAFAGRSGHCRVCGAEVTIPDRPDEQPRGPAGPPPNANSTTRPPEDHQAAGERPMPSLQTYLDQAEELSTSAEAADEPPQTETPSQSEEHPSPAESEPPESANAEPQPEAEEDTSRPLEHFGRLSFEPEEGPTALAGPWLRDEAEQGEQDEAPKAEEVLSGKLAAPEAEPPGEVTRPALLTLACAALALLSAGFLAVFALRGGALGAGVGGLGLALGALGVIRLGSGHMDGLVPAVVHCVCVAGAVLWIILAPTVGGATPTIGLLAGILLAGSGLSLALTITAAMTTGGYLYLHKHS